MSRRLVRGSLTTCLSMLLASVGLAEAPFFHEVIPGSSGADGAARWHDELSRMSSRDCSKYLPAGLKQRADIQEDCASGQVHVISDSDVLMECRATVDLPTPDDLGRKRVEHTVLIGPHEERWLATTYGPGSLAAYAFATRCRVVPRDPETVLATPDTCTAEVTGPGPAEHYPWGAQTNKEEGRVIIEYTAGAPPTHALADVRVVGSSGYWMLDTDALYQAKSLRVTSNCPGQRFRYTLNYRLSEAPPLPHQSNLE